MNFVFSVPDMKFFPSYLKALDENFAYGSSKPYSMEKVVEIKKNPEQHLAELNPPFREGNYKAKDGSTWVYVPQETLWITSGSDFIGNINFRPTIHDSLAKFGGHIGYSITPPLHGKGYMTQALKLFLKAEEYIRQLDRDHMVITTTTDNEASQKVILKAGGKFIDEYFFAPMKEMTILYHIPLVQS